MLHKFLPISWLMHTDTILNNIEKKGQSRFPWVQMPTISLQFIFPQEPLFAEIVQELSNNSHE